MTKRITKKPRSGSKEVYKDKISFVTTQPAWIEKQRIAQEREQHYFFTLHDFEELVRQYGAAKLIADMNEEIFWQFKKELDA